MITHQEKTFENVDYTEKDLSEREFINCSFINCDFSKSNLSNNDFVDCQFERCNFTMAVLDKSTLSKVYFSHCKILGVNFSKCNSLLFSVDFQHCALDYSSFFRRKMKKTKFKDCSLKDVDFEEADLTSSVFDHCDLSNTGFKLSILEKVDFRTSRNYIIDLDLNKVKKAKFHYMGIVGLLAKYDIDIEFE